MQKRVYEMIVNEPSSVKHRWMYAVMTIRLKGEKVPKQSKERVCLI
jgi:hypothetical protein